MEETGHRADETFTVAWAVARPHVLAFCRRTVWDPADADELCQRVAIRAWRGHATFRGDCAYLTWVIRIAEREAVRMGADASRAAARAVSYEQLEQGGTGRADPAETVDALCGSNAGLDPADDAAHALDACWAGALLADALGQARALEAISEPEFRVLLARLRHPDDSWEQTGRRTDLSANVAAVTHCRAVPRLRVFLFQRTPDVLGGPEAFTGPFARALISARDPLTATEAEVFRLVVLERRADYRRRGWQAALRGACAKVIHHLHRAVTAHSPRLSATPDRPTSRCSEIFSRIGNARPTQRVLLMRHETSVPREDRHGDGPAPTVRRGREGTI